MGERSEPVGRRRVLVAATSVAIAGCTELGGGFEGNGSVETDASDDGDDAPTRERLGFGESWRLPDRSVTVTLDRPSFSGQVGQTSAPRERTYAGVPVTARNTGESRETVDPGAFVAVVDGERYEPDRKPQGAVISGIVEPGTTLEKTLYFPVPVGTRQEEIRVLYRDLAVWRAE